MQQELPILSKSIVLVGLMGCGKSALGKRLAKRLEVPFVDIDRHIEQEEKCTVTEMFAKHGEAYFRNAEHAALKYYMQQKEPYIIATGGGVFVAERNRSLIQQYAISLWIKVAYDVLLDRVSQKNTRPLLEQGNKAEILKTLMDERYPIYEKADITVETSNRPHDQMVDKLIAAIIEYNGKKTNDE